MNNYYYIFFLLLLLFSCNEPRFHEELTSIESIIQTEPERAMMELSSINTKEYGDADKGLYSLLYSMALDKNYVDICSDSIILPAISFFQKGHDNYHLFLSYYYLGRVYENAETFDEALSAFLTAESHLDSSVPEDYVSRLYTAKERVYFRQLAMDKALEEAHKAKDVSQDLDNPAFYIRSCLDIITLLHLEGSYDVVERELDSLRHWINNRELVFPSDYYYWVLNSMIYNPKHIDGSFEDYYGLYLKSCNNEGMDPDSLLLADVLVQLKKYDEAKRVFDGIILGPASQAVDSINYYTTAARIYLGLKDYDGYIYATEQNRRLIDTMNNDIFKKDVRFLEERYKNQLAIANKERKSLILSFFVGLLLLALMIGTLLHLKERKEMQRLIGEARNEFSFIKSTFFNTSDTSDDIKTILQKRIQALSPYFQGSPSKPLGRKELVKLKRDNHEMLRSVGLVYSLSFPDFVSSLVKYNLSSEEIGLCSLYASGYITKELTDMVDSGSIYHINSSIRAKLGDEVGGRTLPAWLRDLFASCQKS